MALKPKKEICRVCGYGIETLRIGFSFGQCRLQRSASRGCEVCTFILQGVSACLPLLDLNRSTTGIEKGRDCFFWTQHSTLTYTNHEGEVKIYELYVIPGKYPQPLGISRLLSCAASLRLGSNSLL